jgi:hypothetical protein
MPERTTELPSKDLFTLRPSESHRWTECTASPYFIAEHIDEIDDSESPYAAEGTLAHWKGAAGLLLGWRREDFENAEMADFVLGYIEYCEGQLEKGDLLLVEHNVKLFYDNNETGTTDCAIVHIEGSKITKLRINDLKYGMGVSVQAKNNTQLAIYALSVLEDLMRTKNLTCDWKTLVTISIYQPRVIGEQPVRLWALTYQDLVGFCTDISKKALLVKSAKSWDDVEFKPGEHACRFCGAKPFCGHYGASLIGEDIFEEGLSVLDSPKPILELKDPSVLSPQVISNLVLLKGELVKWLNSVEDYAKNRLNSGVAVPGLKIVRGREGNRAWGVPESEIVKTLAPYIKKADLYSKSMLSPTQIEAALKSKKILGEAKAQLALLVTRSQGSLSIVSADDKRPSAIETLDQEFAFVDDAIDLSLLD